MKKFFSLIVCILCTVLCLGTFASPLSPALEIFDKRLEMKKCITQNSLVSFQENSFDNYFGKDIKEITVSLLPSEESGVLKCGSFELDEGQPVSRDSFNLITFQPDAEFSGVSSFSFSAGERTLHCNVLVSETVNKAPVTGEQTVETQRNITVFKTFSAADSENDSINYEIVKYPRHGSLSVNNTDAMFVYSPKVGYVGKDSFSYKAIDTFGNTSGEQKVQIRVSKPACDVYFSDMEKHWAHNSAIKVAATGLMAGETEGDEIHFNPEKDMTRGDFLALSLITAGLEKEIPYVSQTVFADDSLIPNNIKSYAQYAYDKGIIDGYDNGDGSVNFESSMAVSRAQAAVMVSKILSLDKAEAKGNIKEYTDASAIPSWAGVGINNLTACGIIKGAPSGQISPEKVLSRAEGAEIICNTAQYLEDKEKVEKSQKKSIFNLFGLIK